MADIPPLEFWYRNYKGEISRRQIDAGTNPTVWFGSTEWHPEPQWFLSGFDIDKDAHRDFAIKDIMPESAVKDAQLLDFAEETARKSRTGISFDWVPAGLCEPGGFRAMRRAMIGEPAKTLRGAINKPAKTLRGAIGKLRTEIEGKGHRP